MKDNILNVIFTKVQTNKEDHIQLSTIITTEALKLILENPKKKINVLVNLHILDKWPKTLPLKAKLSYLGFTLNSKIKRVAIVSDRKLINFPTKFFLWLIKFNKKIFWFSNIETALLWLKNN